MADFGNLYDYNTNSGTVMVIPDTSEVKQKIVDAMIVIFGSDISTDDATPLGRIIEALTFLFVNVLGVNAQNANNFNANVATGNALDAIGTLFGTTRPTGMSDTQYRTLILASQSRGSGYAQSIRNALSNVPGVTSICVLENGYGDPKSLPNNIYGLAVTSHSIFVAVAGGTNLDIADSIYASKSAGCGYTKSSAFGTPVTQAVSDGSGNVVTFHRPILRSFDVYISVIGALTDTERTLVRKSVTDFFKEKNNTCIIYSSEIIMTIARNAGGVACSGAYMVMDGESTHRDNLTILPYQYCNIQDANVIITES